MAIRHFVFCLFVLSASILCAQSPKVREWPFYVPDVREAPDVGSAWVRNGIDAFILKRLREAELTPAREATRRQLIRRLYLDLIGVPPSPDEVKVILHDESDVAYEALVDRLLDDSRYGERWARFWLDLARYADTAGYEGDPDLPHAWRYRDYVIDAFNHDKPYTDFIKEQIAGDEFEELMGAGDLPETPPERVVALTFLRLAPFTEPRGDETRHELLSEMTSTVGSVFLGLTVGCAKCHDHKYDNIPTKDFYRLKAFFSTVSIPRPEHGDGFQIGSSLPAPFYREGESDWARGQRAKFEREIEESKRELQQLEEELAERILGNAGFGLQAMGGPLGNDYIFGRTPVHDGDLHVSIANCDGNQWTFYTDHHLERDTGVNAGTNRGHWLGDLPNPKHVTVGQYSEGTGEIRDANAHHVGEFAQILLYDHPLSASERSVLTSWIGAASGALEGPAAEALGPPRDGLAFWLDATDLDANPATSNPGQGSRVENWIDRIGGITLGQQNSRLQPELVLTSPIGGEGSSTGVAGVRFDNDFLSGPIDGADFARHQTGALVVAYTARHTHEGYGFEIGGDGAFLSTFINPRAARREDLHSIINDAGNGKISDEDRQRYRWLASRERFLRQHLGRLEPVAMSLRHSYGPPYEPGVPTSRVMIRGEYDNPGEVVTPGFLSCITGDQEPAKIRLDPFKRWPTRSRRMALAQWIASPQNPLTARVMVNRLWHWHFGEGIVATPSDFGLLGGAPSHPELLDWLAVQLIKEKWKLKAIHRLMVTSATYRQTSLRSDERATKVDPDNRLLWRFRRRRLEAEAVRDSVLVASGRLNPEQFGLPIFPPLPDDIEERVKYSDSKWDTQLGPDGRKRSIYIYQQRTLNMPFLQSFDALVCDESRPKRRQSVTPLQALSMYNGRFVSEEAKHFARRLHREAGGDLAPQIELAFEIALSRPPSTAELSELESLGRSEGAGIAAVCRVLLNCNEFMYVD